jgi:hypothetical protein
MSEEVSQATQAESAGGETTTESTTSGGTSSESTWSYAEGVAGTGEKPEYFKSDKYKTLADQAKAYIDAESRLGGFTGAPSDGYKLNEGIEADANNPLFKGLTEIGAKYNMNNDMYNDIISMYNKQTANDAAAYREAQLKELGDDGQTRIKNINDWVNANVPADFKENFLNWSQSAKDIQALETLIGMTKGQKVGDPSVSKQTAAFTEEGLKELQFAKNERGQRLMSVDPAHAKKVREYIAELTSLQND